MDRWRNRVAIVTGASSGIGAALAKDLVNAGLIVVGLARRKERVEAIRASLAANLQTHLHAVACDVSDGQSVSGAFDWIEAHLGGADVLVNNAGIFKPGQLLTQDMELLLGTLHTNVMGVIYCTRRAFHSMQRRKVGDGHVVLINSILGHSIFNTPPGTVFEGNIYPATKHAITAITEILRQEFRDLDTKIKVTSISPGLVDTEMLDDRYRRLPTLRAEDISAGVIYALGTPPHVQVHELTLKPLGERC